MKALLLGLTVVAFIFTAVVVVRMWMTPSRPDNTIPVGAMVPSFSLIDQNGEGIGREDLADEVWVAAFLFTRCQGQCPSIVANLKELQSRLGDRSKIRIVTFSVDPEFDTPVVLSEYAETVGADAARWTFVTGSRDSIYALAKDGFLLGVKEADDPQGADQDEFVLHSPRLVLVDGEGRIRGYYAGLERGEISRLRKHIDELLAELDSAG